MIRSFPPFSPIEPLILPSHQCKKALSRTQRNEKMNQLSGDIFYELDDSYSRSDSQKVCERDYNAWHDAYGFAYGGLWGFNDETIRLISGDCEHITRVANNFGNIIFGAVRSMCIPDYMIKCRNDIIYDELWCFF